jgi:acyl carrier protein
VSPLDRVRDIVARQVPVADDSARLALDSLALVSIVEDLEIAFDLRIRAADLTPERFVSVEAITAFVASRVG